MRKPENPRHAIRLAEDRLATAAYGRVDISEELLRGIIALARAWTYTRSIDAARVGMTCGGNALHIRAGDSDDKDRPKLQEPSEGCLASLNK